MSTDHEKVIQTFARRLDNNPTSESLNLPERRSLKELEGVWDELTDFGNGKEILELREEALHDYNSQPSRPNTDTKVNDPRVSNLWRWGGLAAAASVCAAIGLSLLWPPSSVPEYLHTTTVGELKEVKLDDGSLVHLDAQTRLKQTYTDKERAIELLQGRARFDVAHDANRPFRVQAGNGQITALGTVFVVSRDHSDVEVTLLEGKVAVINTDNIQQGEATNTENNPLPSDLQPVILTPGQQATYTASTKPQQIASANIEQATSWQEGRLIFEDNRLEQVVEHLNRYSTKKIILGSPKLTSLRVTGVFRTDDHSRAIAALETLFPLKAIEKRNGMIVLLAAAEPIETI
ncbi:FecR family protein [Porticoccus sp. GXU_MW_L64]